MLNPYGISSLLLHIEVEAVELSGVDKCCAGKAAEVIRCIETEWLFELYADLVHRVCNELGTDEAVLPVPFYIEVNCDKTEHVIGIDIPVIGEMAYDALIFHFLLTGNGDAVDLAWYKIIFAESALAYYLLVESCRKRKRSIGAAEAVHLRKSNVA